MPQDRLLGAQRLSAPLIGLGCMGTTGSYGSADETESIATIHKALELGIATFDTADAFPAGASPYDPGIEL